MTRQKYTFFFNWLQVAIVIISLLFLLFNLLGLKISRLISERIFTFIGPFFRSNTTTLANVSQAFPKEKKSFKKKIIYEMWSTYGKILAEYIFIKNFTLLVRGY